MLVFKVLLVNNYTDKTASIDNYLLEFDNAISIPLFKQQQLVIAPGVSMFYEKYMGDFSLGQPFVDWGGEGGVGG